jgi:hypothetical protein
MRPLAILLLITCAACTGAGGQPAAPVPAAPMPAAPVPAAPAPAAVPATLANIQSLVGTPSCTADAQCHSLAIGNRPCGGPESYLAWSSARTDPDTIRSLGERYKAERQAQSTARGEVSDCRFRVDPGAACHAGVCQLGTGEPVAR